MKSKRRKLLLFLLILLLLLIGLPSFLVWREVRQQDLNAALITAIIANDTNGALQALEHGADVNARERDMKKVSVGERFRQLWDRLRGRKEPKGTEWEDTERKIEEQHAILVLFDYRENMVRPPENVRILQALLERGANTNDVDLIGDTPLHRACILHYTASARLLLQHGANVNTPGAFSKTPLHSAVSFAGKDVDCTDMMRLLFEAGADPNSTSLAGATPLYDAVGNDNLKAVQLLLEKGADVNVTDEHGNTLLKIAQMYGDEALIRLLKQHGAK